MKKIVLFVIIFSSLSFFRVLAQNQVSVNIMISPPYSPYIADYADFGNKNIVLLTNNTQNTLQIKLKGSIEGIDNNFYLKTKDDYSPNSPIILAPMQSLQLTPNSSASTFLSETHIETNLTGHHHRGILASGILPEGQYQICIQAVDYFTDEEYSPASPLGCSTIFIQLPSPPLLLNPICESEIQMAHPTFSWSPVTANGFFTYNLYILKLIPEQIPELGMELAISNHMGNPIVVTNIQSSFYQYKPYDIPLEPNATYAWCVIAKDISNQTLLQNDGKSEVCTFKFTPPVTDVPTGTTDHATTHPEYPHEPNFDLNNTSISGNISYKIYENEKFGPPATPVYNPTKKAYEDVLNTLQIANSPSYSSGNSTLPQAGTTTQSGLYSATNFQQHIQNYYTAQNFSTGINLEYGSSSSRYIQIDPTVKHLYSNTLSLTDVKPLRNTSVSVYLEYVALRSTLSTDEDEDEDYFQAIPSSDVLGLNKEHLDPQTKKKAAVHWAAEKYSSVECLGTVMTDENGNFTIDFDLTDNTGFLGKGPFKFKRITEIFDDVYPDIMSVLKDPRHSIDPQIQMQNGINTLLTTNPAFATLPGNQGWGAAGNYVAPGLNRIDGINRDGFTPNRNERGGPQPPEEIFSASKVKHIIFDYTVHYLFKVVRIKINDPYYCHPDILIFPQPGDHIQLPPVAVFVNSFEAELEIISGGKKTESNILAEGQAMSGMNVDLGRLQSWWNTKPDNFPLHEGMNINPEQHFKISSNDPSSPGGNSLRLTAEDISNSKGKVVFKKLFPNKGGVNDRHYFEIIKPQTGIYNYEGTWGSFSSSDLALEAKRSSYTFKPRRVSKVIKLNPLPPEILLRTITKSNIETAPLPDAKVYVYDYSKKDNKYSFKTFVTRMTDQNGYCLFPNLSMEFNTANGLINPYRRIFISKTGYRSHDIPLETNKYIPPIRKGERIDLGEIEMKGGTKVFGFIKDEFDQPITALVKIGNGPYFMTNSVFSKEDQGKVHDNGTPPPSSQTSPVATSIINWKGAMWSDYASQGISLNPVVETNIYSPKNPAAGNTNSSTLDMSLISTNATNIIANLNAVVSKFSMNAPSTGSNTRVIVVPLSEQYFADTFYVNIPYSSTEINLGTFRIYEKSHRVSVQVLRNDNAMVSLPAQNALVQVGEHSGLTDSKGRINFRFNTPEAYFRLFVQDGERVPVEEYHYIPVSKNYKQITVYTSAARRIVGTITDVETGLPIEGARIFCAIGTTEYGETLVQTFSDAQGKYVLTGVPKGDATIQAVKQGNNPTYLGSKKSLSLADNADEILLNFSLEKLDNIHLSQIFGFDVELTSVEIDSQTGNLTCSGAFVNIPDNQNFKIYNPNYRLRFSKIVLQKTEQDQNGIYQTAPVNSYVTTLEKKIRMRLFNNFLVDLQGSPPIKNPKTIYTSPSHFISIAKRAEAGGIEGMVLTDLESFRFSFNYSGQFYISDRTDNLVMTPIVSNHGATENTPSKYYVMNRNFQDKPVDIQFTVHNFTARAARAESTIDKDAVQFKTRLYPQLQLSTSSVIDAGKIWVTPEKIIFDNEGKEINFDLEKWKVSSQGGWAFSIQHGGIVIPNAKIQTSLVDLPISGLILRPTQLIMPASGSKINNLTLGGGVTKLHQNDGTKVIMNFDPACSYDLKPHWRLSIYNDSPSVPACYLKDLPGFATGERINIGSFTVFSNNSTLIQPIHQSKKLYNIADFSIHNISNGTDAFEISGVFNPLIPGITPSTLVLEYSKPATAIIAKTKAINLVLETPGKVYFTGSPGPENYILKEKYFEANGNLLFESDDIHDGNNVKLKGKLIKSPEKTTLSIPKLQDNNSPSAYQYIALKGGKSRLKVLAGEQKVVGNSWNMMNYTADLVGVDGLDQPTLNYIVSGAIEVDASKDNALKIDKIDTPLGGLTMVFDWKEASFLGALNIKQPIAIGTIEISDGLFEIMFSGQGFYFDMTGKVGLPGLGSFLNPNVGLLTGYYPSLPSRVIQRRSELMYLGEVPAQIRNEGIKGIYINANAAPPAANWSTTIPVPLFTIGFGVAAGVDFNFLLHFGQVESILLIDAAAYAKAWAGVQVMGVCNICLGAMAQFTVNGQFIFSPQASASFNACSSFALNGEFCGVEAGVEVGCRIQATTNSGLDIDLQWESCGGSAAKKHASCEF